VQSASCEYFFGVESAEQKTVGTEDSHTKDDGPRTPVREPAVLTLPGFTPDRVTTRTTDDPLDIRGDVQAFARLICLEEAAPPLSIGVFGGWGSGKSTFMEQLEAEIDAITANEAKRRRPLEKAPSSTPSDKRIEPRFVANVVQIRFNAWQFADANLWASLSAEFFDQLRAGGYSRIGKDIHAQLVQRVTDHVHKLSQAVDATRAALVQGERKAADAQRARDIAVAENAETGILSQALVDRINEAYEQHKPDLAEIYPDAVTRGIEDFFSVAKDVRTFGGQVRTIWKIVRGRGWRVSLTILSAFLIFASLAALSFPSLGPLSLDSGIRGWTFLAGIASAAGAFLPAFRVVSSIVKSTAAFAGDLDQDINGRLRNVVEREAELRAAVEEAKARREAVERAAQALARYVDPKGSANPLRLLRFVLDDDPDTKALEKEIGLIGRVRRLFQAVDEIFKEERGKRMQGNINDAEVPDRIILYIDDLDRCTYEQVYAVLQAIHLLLAFELFVVVVGVDVRWIEDALANQSGGRPFNSETTGTEIELDRRKRAIAYLEKIFQIPFWLRPLSTQGDNGGTYGDYIRGLLKSNIHTGDEPAAGAKKDAPPPGSEIGALSSHPAALDEALATVKLTPDEVEFLASPEIGRLAPKSPRGVKRLINVYRIVRARMTTAELQDLVLGVDGKPPTYPIAVLLAAVETGQPVEVADSLYKGLRDAHDEHKDGLVDSTGGFQVGPELQEAFRAVQRIRKGAPISVRECVKTARVVRRYSFNLYQ
jgi:hypothetical protein